MEVTGFSQGGKAPEYHRIQEQVDQGDTCQVKGRVRYYERKPNSLYIYLEDPILNVHSEQYSLKEIIIKYQGSQGFAVGNTLHIDGKLTTIETARNPGQFDARKYYRARNIEFFIIGETITLVDEEYNWWRGGILQLRESFCEKLNLLMPNNGGVLSAMLTGEKSFLEEDVKIRYQMSGLMHIIAISGLHFSILGMGCYRFLTRMGVNFYLAGIISVVAMCAYGVLTGEGVSVLRALVMFTLYIGARFFGRTYDMLSAMALAAILILWEYPGYLYDSSFQLSFAAIIGMGSIYPVIGGGGDNAKKETRRKRIIRQGYEGLQSGIAIWLATLPILLSSYYEVSFYGMILNLLVIPTAGIVLVSGLLGGSVGFLNMFLGRLLIAPAGALLVVYDWLGKIAQKTPYTTLILGKPSLGKCVVYYVVLISFLWGLHSYQSKKKAKKSLDQVEQGGKGSNYWRAIMVVILAISLTALMGYRGDKRLSITTLDVGQGDSLMVTTPNQRHYLIDGGSSSVKEVGKYRIIPFLKSQGIQTIEAVFVTHPDEDHLNGIIELFTSIKERQTSLRVKHCILPKWMKEHPEAKELLAVASDADIPISYVTKGNRIEDGEVLFNILHPGDESYAENTNEGSLTFILKYRDFEGVFTGDLCDEGEVSITREMEFCEFLKVAHHGSKNSTFEPFLERTKPYISVISSSERNSYGHPHPELIARLEAVASMIYQTREAGAITVKTDGRGTVAVEQFCRTQKN